VIEDDPVLVERLIPEGHKARPEAAILFTVEAWDANCPQHIPQMLFAEEVATTVGALKDRIEALEADNAGLRTALSQATLGVDPARPLAVSTIVHGLE